MNQIWSIILTLVGVTGFFLAGRKVWWSWYINIGNQALWIAYAVVTRQWGFLLGAPIYLSVFIPNAIMWTKAHRLKCWVRDEMTNLLEEEINQQVLYGEGKSLKGVDFDGDTMMRLEGELPSFDFNTVVQFGDDGTVHHSYNGDDCPEGCYGQTDECIYKRSE